MSNSHIILDNKDFGLIVIGDEILFGKRTDRHYEHFRDLLYGRGLRLVRCWLLPDEAASLTRHLQYSMTDSLPVFICGGIGATPDDLTRDCAAQAAGTKLERHHEAAALIEAKFGDAAYPARIHMTDLPCGCQLIPNPYNQIPGFHLNRHYFLPGFPEMAWPMAEWVLDQFYYQPSTHIKEQSVQVVNTPESALIPIMEELSDRFASLKMFSLPRIGIRTSVELGFRGNGDITTAIQVTKEMLRANDIPFNE